MSTETATCRDCGHEFEYATCESALMRNFAPRICGECGQAAAAEEIRRRMEERRVERNVPLRYANADFSGFAPP